MKGMIKRKSPGSLAKVPAGYFQFRSEFLQ